MIETGQWLQSLHYAFTTVSPATQARVLAQRGAGLGASSPIASTLTDALGWSYPFGPGLIPPHFMDVLLQVSLVEPVTKARDLYRARVRFSTVGGFLVPHSAYPTTQADAVFLGPDTYRFARLIQHELALQPVPEGGRILDLGCGSGIGGIVACSHAPGGAHSPTAGSNLHLADISPTAIEFARASAALAGMSHANFHVGSLFEPIDGSFDLIIANPPYLNDGAQRLYRHGGGARGELLSLRIVEQSLHRLRQGGRLLLYTGSAIVGGDDGFRRQAEQILRKAQGLKWRYEEIDPDVFGEELETPPYRDADRIAAVSLVVTRTA